MEPYSGNWQNWQNVYYQYAAPYLPAISDFSSIPAAQVANALRGMKHVIEKHGWIQGSIGSPRHGLCMQGAFFYRNAMNGDTRSDLPYSNGLGMATAAALVKAIRARGQLDLRQMDDWNWVITFNDTPGRLKSEVLAVIDEAIVATLPQATPEPEAEPAVEPEAVPAPEQAPAPAPAPVTVPGQFWGGLQDEIDTLMKASQLVSAGG